MESFSSLVHEMRRERYKGTVLVCNKETECGRHGHSMAAMHHSFHPAIRLFIRIQLLRDDRIYASAPRQQRSAQLAQPRILPQKKSRDKGSTRNATAICWLMTVNQRQTDGSERQFKAVKRRGGSGRLVTRHQDLFLLIKGRYAGLTCCSSPDSVQCIIYTGAAEGMHIRNTLSRRQRGNPALLGTEIQRCSSHLRDLIGMISCNTMRVRFSGARVSDSVGTAGSKVQYGQSSV